MYILTTDRPLIAKISNGDISATDHPIHFMFCSRVGSSRLEDYMALYPVQSKTPSWTFRRNVCLEWFIQYPSHLHEIERSFAGLWEKCMRSNKIGHNLKFKHFFKYSNLNISCSALQLCCAFYCMACSHFCCTFVCLSVTLMCPDHIRLGPSVAAGIEAPICSKGNIPKFSEE